MPPEKQNKKQVVVIAGPTGSGKTSVSDRILALTSGTAHLVSATTRPRRDGEENGRDYIFLSRDEFEKARIDGLIPEVRHVEHTGFSYGIYKPWLDEQIENGKIVIAVVDIIGARYLKETYGATTFFLEAEDFSEYERRVREREPNMSEVEVSARLAIAKREIAEDRKFYDHVLVNKRGELEKTVGEVLAILRAEGYSV